MKNNKEILELEAIVTEKGQSKKNSILVKKQIGKQTFWVRMCFQVNGKENFEDKICRLLRNDVQNEIIC